MACPGKIKVTGKKWGKHVNIIFFKRHQTKFILIYIQNIEIMDVFFKIIVKVLLQILIVFFYGKSLA